MRTAHSRRHLVAAAGVMLAVTGLVTGCTASTDDTNAGPTNNANNSQEEELI